MEIIRHNERDGEILHCHQVLGDDVALVLQNLRTRGLVESAIFLTMK